jgi:multidrug efflux pump subunit AcrB
VTLTLPPGATFRQTLDLTEQAEQLVRQHKHVKLVYTAIGGGKAGSDPFMASGAPESNKATLTLNLTPRNDRPGISKQAIENELRQAMDALPGARVKDRNHLERCPTHEDRRALGP